MFSCTSCNGGGTLDMFPCRNCRRGSFSCFWN